MDNFADAQLDCRAHLQNKAAQWYSWEIARMWRVNFSSSTIMEWINTTRVCVYVTGNYTVLGDQMFSHWHLIIRRKGAVGLKCDVFNFSHDLKYLFSDKCLQNNNQ